MQHALATELTMLVVHALWCVGLTMLLAAGRALTPGGTRWAISNRDTAFDFPAWIGRSARAHVNALENLIPFAALVLVVHLSGGENDITAIAACVFVGARIAHSLCYIAGLVPWRTLCHTLSTLSLIALASALAPQL